MRTLILGGYGNFGARIGRALAAEPSIRVLIGGRDIHRSRALAAQLGSGTEGIAIDLHERGFTDALRRARVELVVHAAGPFQQQGYHVAAAAAAAGAHYIDLADGRRFVCDFAARMGPSFVAAKRTAISGASTVPALSSAVVTDLTRGWRAIDSIDTCIAPGQAAPRGQATLAAVLSYCGGPIQVWSAGCWQVQTGWSRPELVRFARMKPRRGALCDIPDLELFPVHYRVGQRVMFRAAIEVPLAQGAFAALAALRGAGIVAEPSRLAPFFARIARALDFLGTETGGMVIRVAGVAERGDAVARAWHVTAGDGHGPEIPCMAAILLARRLARAETMPTGAFACVDMLSLAEFAPEFARWGMPVDAVDESPGPIASTV